MKGHPKESVTLPSVCKYCAIKPALAVLQAKLYGAPQPPRTVRSNDRVVPRHGSVFNKALFFHFCH